MRINLEDTKIILYYKITHSINSNAILEIHSIEQLKNNNIIHLYLNKILLFIGKKQSYLYNGKYIYHFEAQYDLETKSKYLSEDQFDKYNIEDTKHLYYSDRSSQIQRINIYHNARIDNEETIPIPEQNITINKNQCLEINHKSIHQELENISLSFSHIEEMVFDYKYQHDAKELTIEYQQPQHQIIDLHKIYVLVRLNKKIIHKSSYHQKEIKHISHNQNNHILVIPIKQKEQDFFEIIKRKHKQRYSFIIDKKLKTKLIKMNLPLANTFTEIQDLQLNQSYQIGDRIKFEDRYYEIKDPDNILDNEIALVLDNMCDEFNQLNCDKKKINYLNYWAYKLFYQKYYYSQKEYNIQLPYDKDLIQDITLYQNVMFDDQLTYISAYTIKDQYILLSLRVYFDKQFSNFVNHEIAKPKPDLNFVHVNARLYSHESNTLCPAIMYDICINQNIFYDIEYRLSSD